MFTLKGANKTFMKAALYLLVYSTSQADLKNKSYGWQHSNRVLVTHKQKKNTYSKVLFFDLHNDNYIPVIITL